MSRVRGRDLDSREDRLAYPREDAKALERVRECLGVGGAPCEEPDRRCDLALLDGWAAARLAGAVRRPLLVQVKTELTCETPQRVVAGEYELGAELDHGPVRECMRADATADSLLCLEHDDVDAASAQESRGRQTGESRADDDYAAAAAGVAAPSYRFHGRSSYSFRHGFPCAIQYSPVVKSTIDEATVSFWSYHGSLGFGWLHTELG